MAALSCRYENIHTHKIWKLLFQGALLSTTLFTSIRCLQIVEISNLLISLQMLSSKSSALRISRIKIISVTYYQWQA